MNQILQRASVLVFCLLLAAALPGCAGGSKRVVMSHTSRDYAVVRAREADTLKTLANRYLKDPEKSWIIADYNKVDEVHPGDIVLIPVKPFNLGGVAADGYQTVPVLAYSAFSEDTTDTITMKRADFRAQMQYIKDSGYTPISLDDFYNFLEFQEQVPEKAVVITIDDVGQHTYDVAFQLLREFGYPAAVFVTTDLVSGQGAALSWDQIREMQKAGIEIGHRTKTLRNLTRRKADETFEDFVIAVDREMTVANLTFRGELGQEPQYFAYPYGAANELVLSLLEKNGFRGALTMERGANPFFTHNYLVGRNNVPGDIGMEEYGKLFSFFTKEDLQ